MGETTPKKKTQTVKKAESPVKVSVGRKRDPTLDGHILEAAIECLAETGFDRMTMDDVAARAKAGKTTVYRRWDSKAELVRDALIHMSQSSVDLENLPDTGLLRNDLLAVLKPRSIESSQKKLRVLSGLGSFFSEHPTLSNEATTGVFGPLTNANRILMERAQKRGELHGSADIEMAAQIISAMTSYRTTVLNKAFDRTFYATLLDQILLPALMRKPSDFKAQ